MLSQERVEVGPLDADRLGGFAHVAPVPMERLDEESPLQFLDRRIADLVLQLLELLPVLGKLGDRGARGGLPYLGGQMPRFDALGVAKDRHPFDDVSQLADVSRPGVALHLAHRLGRETAHLDFVLLTESLQESHGQTRDVALALRRGGR